LGFDWRTLKQKKVRTPALLAAVALLHLIVFFAISRAAYRGTPLPDPMPIISAVLFRPPPPPPPPPAPPAPRAGGGAPAAPSRIHTPPEPPPEIERELPAPKKQAPVPSPTVVGVSDKASPTPGLGEGGQGTGTGTGTGSGSGPGAGGARARIVQGPNLGVIRGLHPPEALRRRISGRGQINCRVTVTGRLEACRVVSESPPGMGFGAAALRAAPYFRWTPATNAGGEAYESEITFGVDFGPPQERR